MTDKENFKYFNKNLKILADKKKTDQRIVCLQQIMLLNLRQEVLQPS